MTFEVPDWRGARAVDVMRLEGTRVRLERLAAAHAPALHAAWAGQDHLWDYMAYGPFADAAATAAHVAAMAAQTDPWFMAICDLGGTALGVASFLRMDPAMGTVEIGHICLSPALQGSTAATEAFALMAGWVFANGYRRYEWKCNAANMGSRRAAERLGFSFEGVWRQAAVVKGRNRDTAWFAMTDGDWRAVGPAYGAWLSPANFDAGGRQRQALSALTAPHLFSRDPALARAVAD